MACTAKAHNSGFNFCHESRVRLVYTDLEFRMHNFFIEFLMNLNVIVLYNPCIADNPTLHSIEKANGNPF